MKDILIASAVRTPIGTFQGGLKDVTAAQLGATVIRESALRAGVPITCAEHVWMGQVLQAGGGQNPARQAALTAGVPVHAPAASVNLVCGSGLQSVILGGQSIRTAEASVVIAGGMESMSQAPYMLTQARGGYRYGHGVLLDSVQRDGLTCALLEQPMGITAERIVTRYGISREAQDQFAAQSQARAEAAIAAGRFQAELVAVRVPERKGGTRLVERDEHPRAGTTAESLAKLKPAFVPTGSVTAGNSSGINDGAAALMLCAPEQLAAYEAAAPLGLIRGWAVVGLEPEWMGLGPVPAIQAALKRAGLALQQMDLFEINEAFAAQALAVIHELELDVERVNVNGGAIALGHPIGASGARVLVTLLHELKRRQARYGVAALCVGGGHGIAVVVESV
ncbi:acetyl-CoA C-acetyltransferase [Paenibacillus sp. 481]|uniref:acetyl-CoA C-acetyltransferase n=1 Tax=Paenibacillus sp. 481 TaxID=2835869 RepID=UPI001E52F5BC|nr:acetyl-CoA C-acetyltransferase [Paenibacillus sp. 481]UHA74625.1 acetyl-CoA C-acetyltransferase [Paenibacillus sp. 481]